MLATLQSIEDGKVAAALSKVDDDDERRSRDAQYCVGCLRIPLPGTYGRASGGGAAAAAAAAVSINSTGRSYFDVFRGFDESSPAPARSPVVDVHKILERWRVMVHAVVKAAAEVAVVESVDDLIDMRRRRRRQAKNAAAAAKITRAADKSDRAADAGFAVGHATCAEASAAVKRGSPGEALKVTLQATEEANSTDKARSDEAHEATPQATEETNLTNEVPEATPQAMDDVACDCNEPISESVLAWVAMRMPTFIISCVWTDLRCVWCAVLSVVRAVGIESAFVKFLNIRVMHVQFEHSTRLVYEERFRRRGRRR